MTAPEADLSGWSVAPFTGGGYTHDVYRKGTGPGVVLIPELPGIHPGVLGLGNHLVDNGFTVAMPSLFGEPGKRTTAGYAAASILRACVAREFAAFATNKERLGDAFEVIEIDSRPGNEGGFAKGAHSVLTEEVREVDGQPAYEARKRVVEFLTARLT